MALDLQTLVQTGYAHHAAGRIAEAVPRYRRVLLAAPTVGLVQALLATATGRIEDAARAVALEPAKASARLTLANALAAAARLDAAREHYRAALRSEPANAGSLNDWANAEATAATGRRGAAERLYRRSLTLDPAAARVWANRASLGSARGDDVSCVVSLRRSLVLEPLATGALFNFASALVRLRRWDDARPAFRRLLALEPAHADGWPRLLRLLESDVARGSWGERAVTLSPESPYLWTCVADGRRSTGRHQAAAAAYRRAFVMEPDAGAAYGRFAVSLRATDRIDQLDRNHARARASDPTSGLSIWHGANILFEAGRLGLARHAFRRALVTMPSLSGCWQNLGTTLNRFAEIEAAETAYVRAAVLAEEDAAIARSSLLMASQYRPRITAAELYGLHRRWTAERFAPPATVARAAPALSSARRQAGPLRVGFLSPDLRRHPVGFFLQAFLEHVDRGRMTVHLRSTHDRSDRITAWLKAHADSWRDLSALATTEMLETLRAERFDVLVDLAGHSARNSLPVFAARAAPVQVTWGGYVGTTGLEAMDWLVTDRFQTLPGTEHCYTESWLTLPADYICYRAADAAPEVGPLPARSAGYVTFGSFNNTSKINRHVLETWGELLATVPRSRLFLSYNSLDDADMQARILAPLRARGVGRDRVTFRVALDHRDYLAGYHEVDVGLDTFPYSGGLTTCEAIWMGVPVVTLPGDTFASRHSLSHLSNAGLTGTVAATTGEYLRIARDLAADLPALAEARGTMRDRVAASPLCDAPAYAEAFTEAMEKAWRETTGS